MTKSINDFTAEYNKLAPKAGLPTRKTFRTMDQAKAELAKAKKWSSSKQTAIARAFNLHEGSAREIILNKLHANLGSNVSVRVLATAIDSDKGGVASAIRLLQAKSKGTGFTIKKTKDEKETAFALHSGKK